MANNPHLSDAAANAAVNALCALGNSGFLNVYDSTGTGQPASANTAVTTQVRLAHLPLSATAFAGSAGGVAAANAITSDAAAVAGTATWFRVTTSGGGALFDGSVGTSGADLNLNSVAIAGGATVSISSLTFTLPE